MTLIPLEKLYGSEKRLKKKADFDLRFYFSARFDLIYIKKGKNILEKMCQCQLKVHEPRVKHI